MAFIRQSKLRHVFGTPSKKDLRYEGFMCPSTSGADGAQVAANGKLLATCVSSSGAFAAFPLTRTGRQDMASFQITAHTSKICDMSWNPFDHNMLVTCCEGGSIKLWKISDSGAMRESPNMLLELDYHKKRINQLVWHPTAKNVIMAISLDPAISIWNLESGEAILLKEDISVPFSCDFSPDGSKIAVASKDKKFRIYDARSGDLVQEGEGHKGNKSQRLIYLSDNRLFSTGFSSMSKRQYSVWDANDLSKYLMQDSIDTSNATLIPYYHKGLQLLFIAGRGDSAIRYYEISDSEPYIYYIAMYSPKEPQRGLCCAPLITCDVSKNEVIRFYKMAESVNNKGYLEMIQFVVPRKSDQFQEDLYPDAPSDVPALAASDWQSGTNASPNMYSFVDAYSQESSNRKAAKAKGLGGGLGGGGLSGGGLTKSTPAPKKAEPAATPAPAKEKQASQAPAKTAPAASVDVSKLEAEIDDLRKQLVDQAKLQEKVEALEELVKKNNERIGMLESLVQEESDEEEK